MMIKSRKMVVFTVSLVMFLGNYLLGSPLPEDQVQQFLVLIVGWLVAQGVADAGTQGQVNSALRASKQGQQIIETVKSLKNEQESIDASKDK